MGILARKSIISWIYTYIGVAIGYANVLWLYPAIFSPSQLGLWRSVQDLALLVLPLVQLGMVHALVRFYPQRHQDFGGGKGLFLAAVVLGLGCWVVLVAADWLFPEVLVGFFADKAPELLQYRHLVAVLLLVMMLHSLLEAWQRAQLHIVLMNFLKEVSVRLLSVGVVLAYYYELVDFSAALWLLLAVYGTGLVVMASDSLLRKLFDGPWTLAKVPWRRLMGYGLSTMLGIGAMLIITKVDSVMVTGMLGLEANAIYTIAFFVAVVIEIPRRAVSQLSVSLVSKAFAEDDLPAVAKLYRQVSLNQLLVGLLLFLLITPNLPALYALMPNGSYYQQGLEVIYWVALGKLAFMAGSISSEIMIMSPYVRLHLLFIGIMAVATVLLNLWLIPIHGLVGAAIASAVAMTLFVLTKLLFLWWRYGMQPLRWQALGLVVIATALVGVAWIVPLPQLHPVVSIGLHVVVLGSAYLGLVYALRLSAEFNGLVRKGLRTIGLGQSV